MLSSLRFSLDVLSFTQWEHTDIPSSKVTKRLPQIFFPGIVPSSPGVIFSNLLSPNRVQRK